MRPGLWFAAWGLFVASNIPVAGGEERAPVLKGIAAQLIAETTSVQPGKPFTVGLKVTHDETFHTYWKNPGIVGVPFQFAWSLPAGFTAGPIQWPAPEQVLMFHYPAYGYERDIVLLTEIFPPADAVPEKVRLDVRASWMACGSTCHPGSHTFSLTLPAGKGGGVASPHAATFAAARKELPAPLTGWEVQMETPKDAATIRLRLRPLGRGPAIDPATCEFFSSDGQLSSTPAQKWRREADGSLLMTAPRSEHGPAKQTHLPGVLYCPGGWGPDGGPTHMQVNPAVLATKSLPNTE